MKLKVVAHSGEALRNQVGEFSVLSGVDVITVHRLPKKSVADGQYFLMSESAHRDLSFPEGAEVLEGEKSYDIGTIHTFTFVLESPDDEEGSFDGSFAEDNIAVKILRHEIRE